MKTVLVFIIALLPLVHSTVPPEAYDLRPQTKQNHSTDVTLAAWLKEFKDVDNVVDQNKKKFLELVKRYDDITQLFLKLRYENVNNNYSQKAYVKALEELNRDNKRFQTHPLKPYIFEEMLESDKIDDKFKSVVLQRLVSEGANTCPHKQIILKDIDSKDFVNRDLSEVRKTIGTIVGFRSKAFKKQAVEELIEVLPDETIDNLISDLKPVVKEIRDLDVPDETLEKFDVEFVQEGYNDELQAIAKELRKTVRKKQCRRARNKLISKLKSNKDLSSNLSLAEPFIARVESCYRRKGTQSRINYWKSMTKPLEAQYGFEGELLTLKKQGAVYWLRNDFDEAKTIFQGILAQGKKRGDRTLEAYAIYTLARVNENEGLEKRAVELYTQYATSHKDGEKFDEVLMSIVLLNFHLKQYKESFKYAKSIIHQQTSRPENIRNGSALSFAYFWAGRNSIKMNNIALASAMWKRVASEYYSTFYGALGHFMYEQYKGQDFHLEPSRSVTFRPSLFLARFGHDDRLILERATLLLKTGLKSDATCEIMELMTEKDRDNDRVLMKSLLLFAAGDWLESIKAYASLPRSYRGALPSGFEKLLFPKAYEDQVRGYSAKLKVEPEMIFGIIRQESVFNPRARSPAGARGLMQLMPATARYEAKRLTRSYLPSKRRRQLKRDMRNRSNLYRPDDNIAIGVHHVYRLLKKYENPVFVLTAYNASPTATKRWRKNMSTEDILTFIERIPYQETRLYVKLVLRNYFFYKKWYQKDKLSYPYLATVMDKDLKEIKKL